MYHLNHCKQEIAGMEGFLSIYMGRVEYSEDACITFIQNIINDLPEYTVSLLKDKKFCTFFCHIYYVNRHVWKYVSSTFIIYKKCINFTHLSLYILLTLSYSSFHFGEFRIHSKSKVSLRP